MDDYYKEIPFDEGKVVRYVNNGNLVPHIYEVPGKIEKVMVIPPANIRKGQQVWWGLQNLTNEIITVKEGYNTTAGGRCEDVVLEPGEIVFRSFLGDGYQFDTYTIFKP